MSDKSEPHAIRRRYGCVGIGVVVLALFIGIPWAWSAVQQAQWDANSGTQVVEVEGARWGEGYELADTAVIETWAEHEETAIHLQVARTSDKSSRTPIVALEIDDELFPIRCVSARGYIWSTDQGSTLTLLCDGYMSLERIRDVNAVSIDLSTK